MEEMRLMLKCGTLIGLLLLLLPAAESNLATFTFCYGGCYIECILIEREDFCGPKCLIQCILSSSNPATLAPNNNNVNNNVNNNTNHVDNLLHQKQSNYFCNLGCGISSCSNISSKGNPNAVEVGRCVETCSGACGKNY